MTNITEIILLGIVALFFVAEINLLLYFVGKEGKNDKYKRVTGANGSAWR